MAATQQPAFFYDFASAESYLLAERVNAVLDEVPEWIPIRIGGPAFRCAEEEEIHRVEIERRARELGLQPVRWPQPYPPDSEAALLAATYAKQIGRAVAFSLAAFRQAFAGGRDLGERDWVLIAAAACELHPTAVLRGIESARVRARLDEATAKARAEGVRDVPAVRIGGRLLHGERAIEATVP